MRHHHLAGIFVSYRGVVLLLLLLLPVALLGVLFVELDGVVAVDVAVAGAGDGVDGTLALLEAGGGNFGCVCVDYVSGMSCLARYSAFVCFN